MSPLITLKNIKQGISYSEYLELTRELLSRGMTTCSNDSPSLVGYTQLNLHRMERLNRTIQLETETINRLRHLSRPMYWVLLSEAWCGDAAQNVPVIAKMAEQTDQIKLIILLRDENPHIMDRYLTEGARAIPRLICLRNPDLRELWTWGPRPEPAQQLMKAHKAKPVKPKETGLKNIQLWYARDRGRTIQRELIERIAQTEN
jgi:hypothetical protein